MTGGTPNDATWVAFDTAAAAWLLGAGSERFLSVAAASALQRQIEWHGRCDLGALWLLASADACDRWDTVRRLHEVYESRGLELPLSDDCTKAAADGLLIELVLGRRPAEQIAANLWSVADTDPELEYPLLSDFRNLAISLDIMHEVADTPEFDRDAEIAVWREELLSLAKAVLARGGISHTLVLDGDRVCRLDELDDADEPADRPGPDEADRTEWNDGC